MVTNVKKSAHRATRVWRCTFVLLLLCSDGREERAATRVSDDNGAIRGRAVLRDTA
jgi:hypothetical protein